MKRSVLFATLGLLAALPVIAGVVFEIEVTDHGESSAQVSSIEAMVEGNNLKMDLSSFSDTQGELIFLGDSREMLVLDHQNKSYHRMDEAMIQGLASQLQQAQKMMEEALKNVPEEQRAMVEEMMKKNMPDAAGVAAGESGSDTAKGSEVVKTSERAEKNGYPSVKYEMHFGGGRTSELWVTDWKNVEGGSEVFGAFEGLAEFVREMVDSMPAFVQRMSAADASFAHLNELGGFPVLTREFAEDGTLTSETTLHSAKRQAIEAGAFEPPAGYRQQALFGAQ